MFQRVNKAKSLPFWSKLVLTLLIILELVSREMGLNELPLFKTDNSFEIVALPNQNTRVYGHRFFTNEYSMRSEPVDPTDTNRILLLGDSITFGDSSHDNDSLASSLLQNMLCLQLKKKVQVLNISTPGWNPDDVVQFLKKYGTFNAKGMILVANSLDVVTKLNFESKSGLIKGFTTSNHYFATQTLIEKSLDNIKRIFTVRDTAKLQLKRGDFNSGFSDLDSICKSKNIPFVVYLHSMHEETTTKQYNSGGEEIIAFCRNRNIPLISGINLENAELYTDGGHFSYSGQRFLANILDSAAFKILTK